MTNYNILGVDFDINDGNPAIDQLFDEVQLDDPREDVRIEHLPSAVRPIIEHLHETRPDIVIAADRGARLISLATWTGWKSRYPSEPFPADDGRLYFGRITGSHEDQGLVDSIVDSTVERYEKLKGKDKVSRSDLCITLLDDWVGTGETSETFLKATADYAPPSLITCFGNVGNISPHFERTFTANTRWRPCGVEWDGYFDEYSPLVGVKYIPRQSARPRPDRNKHSLEARQRLLEANQKYYAGFLAAVATGDLTPEQIYS